MKLFQWYTATQDDANKDEQIYLYLLREDKNTFDAIEISQAYQSLDFTEINIPWMNMKLRTKLFIPCESQFHKMNGIEKHFVIRKLF